MPSGDTDLSNPLLLNDTHSSFVLSPHHGERTVIAELEAHGGKSSLLRVSFNFINVVVGAGIVGLPYVFKESGFVLGLILMGIACLLTDYSVRLLVNVGIKVGVNTYEDLCKEAFGNVGYLAVSLSMLLFDYGAMLTYLIIMADASSMVMYQLLGMHCNPCDLTDNCLMVRRACTIVGAATILPLCLFRDISRLEKMAVISVMTIIAIIAIVIGKFAVMSKDWTISYFKPEGIGPAFGTIAFAFVCHDSAFLMFNTLKQPTTSRWGLLAHSALGGSLVICLALAVPGYLTFGANVSDNLLNNYARGEWLIIGMRVLYTISMSFTYPTAFYVVRHVLNTLLFRGDTYHTIQKNPIQRHLLLSLPLFLSSLLVCMWITSLGSVMSVTGGVAAVTIAFILPPMCALKLSPYQLAFWKNKGKVCASVYEHLPQVLLLLFGLVALVVSTIQSVQSMIKGPPSCNPVR